jgi:hypothetical protein
MASGSPATLTAGRSANESLEFIGALLGYRGVGESCRSNLSHSGVLVVGTGIASCQQ